MCRTSKPGSRAASTGRRRARRWRSRTKPTTKRRRKSPGASHGSTGCEPEAGSVQPQSVAQRGGRPAAAGPAARGRENLHARAQSRAGLFRRAQSARRGQGAARPHRRGASAVQRGGQDQSARAAGLGQSRPGAARAQAQRRSARHASTRRCALAPDDIDILNHHANALLSLGRAARGARRIPGRFWRARRTMPRRGVNCGIAQAALGMPEAALAEFDAALSMAPGHPVAHYNRGIALFDLGRYADAVDAARRALSRRRPNMPAPGFIAAARLPRSTGSTRPLPAMARRWRCARILPTPNFIEVARVAHARRLSRAALKNMNRAGGAPACRRREPQPAALARRISAGAQDHSAACRAGTRRYHPVRALCAASGRARRQCRARSAARIEVADGASRRRRGGDRARRDAAAVRRALSARQPAAGAQDRAWRRCRRQFPILRPTMPILPNGRRGSARCPRPRIAIAWSGNASHDNDRNRSIAFRPPGAAVRSVPNASFISIQRDVRSEDAAALAAAARVTHVGGELEDFTDTAAVDGAVRSRDRGRYRGRASRRRHGPAALGAAAVLRRTGAGRCDGDTTPWYPTARLFRQTSLGDWDGVIARVGDALVHFIGENAAGR